MNKGTEKKKNPGIEPLFVIDNKYTLPGLQVDSVPQVSPDPEYENLNTSDFVSPTETEKKKYIKFKLKERVMLIDKLNPTIYAELYSYFVGISEPIPYFQMSKIFFNKMLIDLEFEEDFELLNRIIFDVYKHYNFLYNEEFEEIAAKCIRLGCPQKMNVFFSQHRGFLFYPKPSTIERYLDWYIEKNNYNGFYKFIEAIRENYYIEKNSSFYNKAIDFSWKNGDKETVVNLFLSILDYSQVSITNFNEVIYANKHLLIDCLYFKEIEKYIQTYESKNDLGVKWASLLYRINKTDSKRLKKEIEIEKEKKNVESTQAEAEGQKEELESKNTEEEKTEKDQGDSENNTETKDTNNLKVQEEPSEEQIRKDVIYYYGKSLESLVNNINKEVEALISNNSQEKLVLYNYSLKNLTRKKAGCSLFKLLNKNITNFFVEEMRIDLNNPEESEIEEKAPEEFVLPSEEPTKEEKTEKKQTVDTEKEVKSTSLQMHIPRRRAAKPESEREEGGKSAKKK
eukprot:CAMPEP_0170520894 /NCGR_PEP_ID=MMETSP0209-20121228/6219_1 /TAXON_ID=665100 ORGANISM="Litonotus pictus, Strain P1" /NCGR_SAMPLE_ID=MMETSP0209 /ASSEMBLY_ACC=CAM_ASM_000301 /LENGTH=510 /DNA_ID=CAMNT_0010807473 /DNA_START=125 /DNA_END=1657 /DNA_ORIENTATION=-